jgi:hypothetical protein
MHEPTFEGTTSMNVVSRSASMVLANEVGLVPIGVRWLQRCQGVLELYTRCLVAFGTSHLRVAIMEVAVLGLFGVWFEAQVF